MDAASGSDGFPVEGVEVEGRAVRALVRAARRTTDADAERTNALLGEYGLDDPRPGRWYPLTEYLRAVADLTASLGPGRTRELGRHLARTLAAPGDRAAVPEAMVALDERYRASHRGGDVGGYDFRQIGAADGRVECRTPYPCALDQGVVEGTADAVADGVVRLREVGPCRETDGDRCTYDLTW